MIGWIISRTVPQGEAKHMQDIANISKSAPIPTYVPVHLFFRSVSRYTPLRKPVREIIAPRVVFVQAGFRNIKRVQELRTCEGIVLDNDFSPYVIDPEVMAGFIDAVEHGNEMITRLEQEALGRLEASKKATWHKFVGDEIKARLHAIVGFLPGVKK